MSDFERQSTPIPVQEALRLIELALEDCDKATPGRWRLGEEPDSVDADADFPVACTYQPHMTLAKSNAVAIVLARATMRPMLVEVHESVSRRVEYGQAEINPGNMTYLPLVALMAHYDATRPDWRKR